MQNKQPFKLTPEVNSLAIYMGVFPRNIPFEFKRFYNTYITKYSKHKTIKSEFEFMSIITLALETHKFCHYKVDYEKFDNGAVEFTTYQTPITNETQFHQLYYNSLEHSEQLFLVIRDEHIVDFHSITERMFQKGYSNYDSQSKKIQDTFWELALIDLEKLLMKVPEELWHEHELYQ